MSAILQWIEHLMGSPIIYAALFGLSLLDALVPVFPSEAPLIMAGVYAGSQGTPNLFFVMFAGFAGALIGDHLAYLLGRLAAPRIDRISPESRAGRLISNARRTLDRRGGMALVIARFIPWGRIATTLVLGATRFPRTRFTLWDCIGVGLWAVEGCLVGYVGGAAFEHDPIKGLVLGIALAMVLSTFIERTRWWLGRRTSSSPERSTGAGPGRGRGTQFAQVRHGGMRTGEGAPSHAGQQVGDNSGSET